MSDDLSARLSSLEEQLTGVLNGMQAQLNSLSIIVQVQTCLVLMQREGLLERKGADGTIEWLRRHLSAAIGDFESYEGDRPGDEEMKARMRLVAHDYLVEMEAAIEDGKRRARERGA